MKKLNILCLFVFVLSGCQMAPYEGEARDVKRRPQDGGVVAIPRKFRPEDRTRAEETMRSVCAPLPFRVVEEGEVVTGQEVTANARDTHRDNTEHQAGSLFGMPIMAGDRGGHDTQTSTVSKDVKEWQLTYACDKPAPRAAENKSNGKIKPIRAQ